MVLVVTRLVDAVPVHATVEAAIGPDEHDRIQEYSQP